jgi:hypothetical protein
MACAIPGFAVGSNLRFKYLEAWGKITLDFNQQMFHTGSSLNIAVMVSAIICLTT